MLSPDCVESNILDQLSKKRTIMVDHKFPLSISKTYHCVSLRISPLQRDLGRLEGGVFWGLVIPVTRQSGIRKKVRLEGGC